MSLAALIIACASCGSGGDSPLILYPNEGFKAYLGASRQTDLEAVYPNGEIGKDNGPDRKDVVSAAAGATFLTDFFATLTVPQITNWRAGEHRTGTGDWAVEGRWTALPATMISPFRPQVQVIAGYKSGNAPSIHETKHAHQLDVMGTGFPEAKLGADLWWGQDAFKFGLAEVFGFAQEKDHLGMAMHPGHMSRTTLTAGYGSNAGKVMLGTNLLHRAQRTIDGERLDDSETLDHGVYVAGDLMVVAAASMRLSFARTAAFGQNRNTVRSRSVTLAVMGSL